MWLTRTTTKNSNIRSTGPTIFRLFFIILREPAHGGMGKLSTMMMVQPLALLLGKWAPPSTLASLGNSITLHGVTGKDRSARLERRQYFLMYSLAFRKCKGRASLSAVSWKLSLFRNTRSMISKYCPTFSYTESSLALEALELFGKESLLLFL